MTARSEAIRDIVQELRKEHKCFLAFHKELNDLIKETLEHATEENKIFLKNFLDSVENKILKIHIK